MAKVQLQKATTYAEKPRTKRPGVHSKCRTSRLKSSKNYVKAYRGQGR